MSDRLTAQWARVRARLRAEIGEATFRSLLKPLTLEDMKHGDIFLSAPTKFMRDWVEDQFGARLLALWSKENPNVTGVDIAIAGPSESKAVAATAGRAGERTPHTGLEVGRNGSGDGISAPLDLRFTFRNFIVGKPNELAFAAARRVADSVSAPSNPLFLYGGVGLGKTHLMHAIAWHIRSKSPERSIIYMSAEKFMYQFIRALRYKDTMAFKEQFRSVDILMIDDVQFISGKDNTQEEFFHTFNALVDQNRQVVISADKSPTDLEGIEERMKSRLGWGFGCRHSSDHLRVAPWHSAVQGRTAIR